MVSHVAKYFALLSRIYMFWGSDQMTFEGGGGGKFSQYKIFVFQLTNKSDSFSSLKVVHDIKLIEHDFFLALGCCRKLFFDDQFPNSQNE